MIAVSGSLVLVGEAAEDGPGNQVADSIDDGEGGHASRTMTVCGNLGEWVTMLVTCLWCTPALIVAEIWVFLGSFRFGKRIVLINLILVVVKLVVHE